MKIAIYNPLSGHGHLDSWNTMFVRALLEAGHGVVAITPRPSVLRESLEPHHVNGGNLVICGIARPTQVKRPLSVRLQRLVWRSVRDVRKWMGHRTGGVVTKTPTDGGPGVIHPLDIAASVATARQAGVRPDIVLVMYMDLVKRDAMAWQQYDHIARTPWAGLRFHIRPAAEMPTDGWFQSNMFRGFAFLAEDVCMQHRKWFPNKRFECLPEITTHATCPEGSGLVATLLRHAKGRKIVFYGGSIGCSKDLATWGKVAAAMDPTKWFFCLVGQVYKHDLGRDDIAVVEALSKHPPENMLLHLHYIETECEFNALIAASDVVYAVYKDFPYSSNIITKAAWLEKPVIVSDRFVMGQRVRRYGSGETVPEGDVEAIVQAIERSCVRTPSKQAFATCRAECNEKALGDRLDAWLLACAPLCQ